MKTVARTNLPTQRSFIERMQFDIYKRQTREEKVQEVRKVMGRKKSIGVKDKENLFERLVNDSQVRREKRKIS